MTRPARSRKAQAAAVVQRDKPAPSAITMRQIEAAGSPAAARRLKAQAAAQAFTAHRGRGLQGAVTVSTRVGGHVRIASVEYQVTKSGDAYVDVWLDGASKGGDPHFRIFNPPQLVEDPQGDIVRHEQGETSGISRTRRFRHDPVGAIAEAVSAHGGQAR